jgi:hypothetical protein
MAPQKSRDQLQGEEWFPYVLSKLYPIEWMEFVRQPDRHEPRAPRFCWRYDNPGATAYTQIERAIADFRGAARWKLYGGYRRCCIAAFAQETVALQPLPSERDSFKPSEQGSATPDATFLADAMQEIPALCRHIEERLGLRDALPRPLQDHATERQRNPLPPHDVEDFVEPGMHTVWLVRDPAAFEASSEPTSRSDRMLHFGLTHEEWYTIFFEVLGVDRGDRKLSQGHVAETQPHYPAELKAKISAYPMLSRIRGYLYDAVFETEEIRRLHQECRLVKARTSNPIALRGIEKLLRISAQASRLGLSIYLKSQ